MIKFVVLAKSYQVYSLNLIGVCQRRQANWPMKVEGSRDNESLVLGIII